MTLSDVLWIGLSLVLVGCVGILADEGLRGLRQLLDVRGGNDNPEPVKRVLAHAFVVIGLALVGYWVFLEAVFAATGWHI